MKTRNHLDSFDHVVVLMLENRSFDNVFGFLYDGCLPPGKSLDGAAGHSNPGSDGTGPVFTTPVIDYHAPFPDPGEYLKQVHLQLYDDPCVDYNTKTAPNMQGFVRDYQQVLEGLALLPEPYTWDGNPAAQSRAIMQCLAPDAIPALSAMARQFSVFDNWFCALPSATWPNRAFWHADTSWGWADNPNRGGDASTPWSAESWLTNSGTPTLFRRLDERFGTQQINWRVYSDQPIALTAFIHWGELGVKLGRDHFPCLEHSEPAHTNFFQDCAAGKLPTYSFLEPRFLDFVDHGHWHDDMHPSEWIKSPRWVFWGRGGPGSVLLGDQLVLKVYEAIRTSPQRDRTLLIVTFDEHGGCFDHVPPPLTVPPDPNTFSQPRGQYGFDFERLGPRVPTLMVSSHIAPNTIVHDALDHASFLHTMQQKWGLEAIGPRQAAARDFADDLFTDEMRAWPDLSHLLLPDPPPLTEDERALLRESDAPANDLQALLCDFTNRMTGRLRGSPETALPERITMRDMQTLLHRTVR